MFFNVPTAKYTAGRQQHKQYYPLPLIQRFLWRNFISMWIQIVLKFFNLGIQIDVFIVGILISVGILAKKHFCFDSIQILGI